MNKDNVQQLWRDEIAEIILLKVGESKLNYNQWMDNGDREHDLKDWLPKLLKDRSQYRGHIPGLYHSSEVSWNDNEVWARVDYRYEGDLYTVEVFHNLATQFTNERQGTLFANHRQSKLF